MKGTGPPEVLYRFLIVFRIVLVPYLLVVSLLFVISAASTCTNDASLYYTYYLKHKLGPGGDVGVELVQDVHMWYVRKSPMPST